MTVKLAGWHTQNNFKGQILQLEPQNSWDGQHLWRLFHPKPLIKPRSTKAGCPGPCPVGFWLLPRMETTQPTWATCYNGIIMKKKGGVGKGKKALSCSNRPFCIPVSTLVLSLGTNGNSLALSLFPSYQVFIDTDKISLSHLSPRRSNPSHLRHASNKRNSTPFIIFVALCWTISSTSISLV